MRRFWLPAVVLVLTTAVSVGQESPVELRDGQQVTVTGHLTMEPAGRLQFVTVKTAEPYQPIVQGENGKGRPAGVTNEIGLSGYNRYELLYAHGGQAVTVSGTITTDSASPYYFHNALLKVTSIRLANGRDLIGTPRQEITLAAYVKTYHAMVLLPADLAAPWNYNPQSAPFRDGARSLACSSNGGGDVVNCFCVKGFHPTGGQSAAGGSRQEARLFPDGSTAQFDVGDDKHDVELSVTCSR